MLHLVDTARTFGRLEACALAGCSPRTLDRARADGELPYVVVDRAVRIDEADLLRWARARNTYPRRYRAA